MSKSYELIAYENDKIVIKEEGINFLKSINEEIIIITVISSLEDKISSNPGKVSVLSNLTNSVIEENLNNNTVIMYTTNIKKDNLNSKVLLLDFKGSNQHILSLLFFASSLFIFCVEGNINEKELNQFILLNSLPDTIKFKNRKEKETIIEECSPHLIFFLSNFNSILPDNYLETKLLQNENEADKNVNLLKENIIKYFPERECILEEDNKKNDLLINKIIEEINPKSIKGKLFDGNSLAFFIENFWEIHQNKGNPKFNELFNNLINNDLERYKNDTLNYFNSEIQKLDQIENEENLIPKIYQIKLDSMEKFSQINYLINNLLNKPENVDYKTSYMNTISELEKKFTEQENLKILKNLKKSEQVCNELLNKHYETINRKIINGEYNNNNTDEYIKDYEEFINGYKNEAKGNNKMKCLINFLEINKPKYFKYLLNGGIDYKNEKQKGQMNKKEEKLKRIEEIQNKIDRKKREIKNLKAEMDRIEEEIEKVQLKEEKGLSDSIKALQDSK